MTTAPLQIDVRGPRFSAAVTFAVLALAFALRAPVLLALQVGVFAVGALAGLRWSPYGNLFRFLKRRLDLGPPPATEPEAGPRFSQLMGLLFSGGGLAAIAAGELGLGWALVLIVVALSGLLAATGLCVGCEVYALRRRFTGRARPALATFGGDELRRLGVGRRESALVLFTAPTCSTCTAAKRVLDEVSQRCGVPVVVADVTAHAEIAAAQHVYRVPTTFLVDSQGRALTRISGVPRDDELERVLASPQAVPTS